TSYQLILLSAPAGYGKTTLLADTVNHFSLTCCWYSLDSSDQDGATFIKMLLASIRQRFPEFGRQLDALMAKGATLIAPAFQEMLDALSSALATDISEQCILALCNYQEVNSSAIVNEIVSHLLK